MKQTTKSQLIGLAAVGAFIAAGKAYGPTKVATVTFVILVGCLAFLIFLV